VRQLQGQKHGERMVPLMNSEFGEILGYLKEIKERKVPGWEKEWEIAVRIYKNGDKIISEIYNDILTGIADNLAKNADSEWNVIIGFNDENDSRFICLHPDDKELKKYYCILVYKKEWEGKGLYITLENEPPRLLSNWFFGIKKGKSKEETSGQKVFEMREFRNEILDKLRNEGYTVKEEDEWYYAWKYATNQNYQYRFWDNEEFLISALNNKNDVIQAYANGISELMKFFQM
jgi:hypothetical protein